MLQLKEEILTEPLKISARGRQKHVKWCKTSNQVRGVIKRGLVSPDLVLT